MKVAGYEAMQGNFGMALKTLTLSPSTYNRQSWRFEPNGGDFFHWKDQNSSLNAYNSCPPIAAIVNRQTQAYVTGKTWILNNAGKAKGKEATSADAVKLRNLMRRPNPLQSWKQFEAQGKIYQKLYGYNIVHVIKPFGFTDPIDANALWNVTPWCEITLRNITSLFGVNGLKDVIASVQLVYEGMATTLNLDDLFIMQDLSASFSNLIFPTSPLQTLEGPIGVIVGAIESEKVIIGNRGPAYVISSAKTDDSGVVALLPGQKTQLQDDFSRYGFREGQWRQIITNQPINVQAMGYNMAELMLHDSIREATVMCCGVLNFPPFILGLADTTYNNMEAAEKGLYQNSVIPDAENNYEQWNGLFRCEQRGFKIDKDFAHVPVLQANLKELAQARLTMNQALKMEFERDLLTVNRWLELAGEDAIAEGNVYWSVWKASRGIQEPQQLLQNANTQINGTETTN